MTSRLLNLRWAITAALVGLGLGGAASCSTGSEWQAPECREDADCRNGTVCHRYACVSPDSLDGGPATDAGVTDSGQSDAASSDDAGDDAGATDAGQPDAGDDAGSLDDAGDQDAGQIDDAGQPDAGAEDAGVDAGPADAGVLTYLAPAGATTVAGPVDGISCLSTEHLEFHIHAHLTVYVDGEQKLIPPGIGIGTLDGGGACYSFLHTHYTDGNIHIESPTVRVYTLGNLFNVWGIPLSDNEVGPASGTVTAYLNGELFTGDITTIPMEAHNIIQLDVGTPIVPPQPYTFPGGL